MDRNPLLWMFSNLTICVGVNIIVVANAPHFVALSIMTAEMVLLIGATLLTATQRRKDEG